MKEEDVRDVYYYILALEYRICIMNNCIFIELKEWKDT